MKFSSLRFGRQPMSAAMLLTLTLVSAVPVTSLDMSHMQLTDSNFTSSLSRGLWFIEFYSPQCSHCIKFAPTWEKLVDEKTRQWNPYGFFMAQVNCLAQGDLCDANGVAAYPTLKLFRDGTEVEKFSGKRNHEVVSDFIDSRIEGLLHLKTTTSTPTSTEGIPNPDGQVLILDSGSFSGYVKEKKPMFVKFYAPWCGHCKKLAPIWIELAEKLKGVVTIAEVDCEKHKSLCKKEKVPGFPQLVFYDDGEKMEYRAARSLGAMQEWVVRATSTGLFEISRNDLDAIVQKEPVFYLYLQTFLSSPEELARVESASKILLGNPPVFRTQDPNMFTFFHVDPHNGPVVIAVKDHVSEAASTFSLTSSPSSSSLSSWLAAETLPTMGELSTHNFDDVMRSPAKPIVVLGAISKEAKQERDTLMQAAKAWKLTGKKVQGRPVLFVWMDNDRWSSWIKSMYGIRAANGPAVVVVDHSNLVYYNGDTKKAPMTFKSDSIFSVLHGIDAGTIPLRHSENIMERAIRALNGSIEGLGAWVTKSPYSAVSLALCFLGIFVYAIRKFILSEMPPAGSYSNGHVMKAPGRLD